MTDPVQADADPLDEGVLGGDLEGGPPPQGGQQRDAQLLPARRHPVLGRHLQQQGGDLVGVQVLGGGGEPPAQALDDLGRRGTCPHDEPPG